MISLELSNRHILRPQTTPIDRYLEFERFVSVTWSTGPNPPPGASTNLGNSNLNILSSVKSHDHFTYICICNEN